MRAKGFNWRGVVVGCVLILLGMSGSLWRAFGQVATMPAAMTQRHPSLANMKPAQQPEAIRAWQAELQRKGIEALQKQKAQILEKRLTGHTDGVLSVRFSPDGKKLASGGADETVRVWDVASGKELKKLEGHKGQVWTVAFSWDGKYLLSGGTDEQIIAWNVETGEIEGMWSQTDYVYRLVFVSKDNYFVSAEGNDLVLYQIGQDAPVQRMQADGKIRSVVLTNNGGAVTGDEAGSLILWDTSTWQRTQVRKRPKGDHNRSNVVRGLYRLQNGDILVADTERLWRWNLQSGKISPMNGIPCRELTTVNSDLVAICGLSQMTELMWLGEQRNWPIIETGTVNSVCTSPSGEFFAVACSAPLDANRRLMATGPTDVEIYNTLALAQEQAAASERARKEAQAKIEKMAATRPGMKVPNFAMTQPALPPPVNPWH